MTGQRGFALVAVMFLLLAAAAAAGVAQLVARSDLGQGEALVRQARLASAIDGAAALAAADLLDPEFASRAPPLDGSEAVVYPVGEARVAIRAVSEAGRLNINSADTRDVADVIRGAGAPTVAEAVARNLEIRRRGGTKFNHIVEMRALFGDEGAVFRAVAPYFTTSDGSAIDARLAPPGLRRVLSRLGPAPAEPPARTALPLAGAPAIALFIEAETPGGARLSEERIVTWSPQGDLLTLERRPMDERTVAALFETDS